MPTPQKESNERITIVYFTYIHIIDPCGIQYMPCYDEGYG